MGYYLYCPHCGEYLGSLGNDYCRLCDRALWEPGDASQAAEGERNHG